MAKNETSFKKGQSGNPNGAPKLSELERDARDAGRWDVAEAYIITRGKTFAELVEIKKNPQNSAIVMLMASNLIKGITTGDWALFDKQLDRVVGKVKQAVQVTGADEGPVEIAIKWPE